MVISCRAAIGVLAWQHRGNAHPLIITQHISFHANSVRYRPWRVMQDIRIIFKKSGRRTPGDSCYSTARERLHGCSPLSMDRAPPSGYPHPLYDKPVCLQELKPMPYDEPTRADPTPDTRIRSYRDLAVWQRAMDVAVECYRATPRFPKHETYGLTAQLHRA